METDDLQVFPIAFGVSFVRRHQMLAEIHPENVERAAESRSPAPVHAENHYGFARQRLQRNR